MRRETAGVGLLLVLFMFLLVLEPLPVRASSPIVFDFSNTNNCTPCSSSLTWSHTVGSGSNGILIVGLSHTGTNLASSVTLGTTSLSRVSTHSNSIEEVTVELWSLLHPPSGTATVTVTFSSFAFLVGGSVSYVNVASTGTVTSADNGSTDSSTASLTVASSSGDLVVDTRAALTRAGYIAVSVTGSGQTQHWNSGSLFG